MLKKISTIDGVMLRDMIVSGTKLLQKNQEKVDALNVFPVPDGDTGINMSLTMQSASKEVAACDSTSASEVASYIAKGALRGARGNSGVILSQLFRGFAKELNGIDVITPIKFALAMEAGATTAYKAVMKPKEGTILTVARVIASEAKKQAEKNPDDFIELFNAIMKSGEYILKKTPEMLPVLKQAGVVDSGGCGLLYIYSGFNSVIKGEDLENTEFVIDDVKSIDETISAYDNQNEFNLKYRLKFKLNEKLSDDSLNALKRRINRHSQYIYISTFDNFIEVLCHTDEPNKILSYALDLSNVDDVNIKFIYRTENVAENKKQYGMVAVSLGEGFNNILKELGVDKIVDGGQTMNPSIDDIYNAINTVNAENVFIFPNNGNILLAAQQAAELSKSNCIVIPTKNVAMSISSIIAFNDKLSLSENIRRMNDASEAVKTAMVTYAVRDSNIDDLQIKKGDYIGLANGKVASRSKNVNDVVLETLQKIANEDISIISIYYGHGIDESDAQEILNMIQSNYDFCDVELQYGGQPLYYYLISVE